MEARQTEGYKCENQETIVKQNAAIRGTHKNAEAHTILVTFPSHYMRIRSGYAYMLVSYVWRPQTLSGLSLLDLAGYR